MQTSMLLPDVNILPKDGTVFLYENEIQSDYAALRKAIDWKHQKIRLFGRWVLQPRLSAWYGDEGTDYAYSGLLNRPLPWNRQLLMIKQQVEEICNCDFNSVLLNLYRHGQDSMGWHQDNETELGERPTIASVSFGESRHFQMRHKFDKSVSRINVQLQDGSVLIMSGETQKYWQHQIPKTKKQVGERINLTFRKIITLK